MSHTDKIHAMIIREIIITVSVIFVFGLFYLKDGMTKNFSLALCNMTIVMILYFIQEHEVKTRLRKDKDHLDQLLSCNV